MPGPVVQHATKTRQERFASNVGWSIGDQMLQLAIGFVSLAVLTQFVPAGEMGLLGVATSLLALVVFFDISPGAILLRDEVGEARRNLRLTALYIYAMFRLFGMVGIAVVSAIVLPAEKSALLTLVTVLFAFNLGIIGVKNISVDYAFSQYEQRRITQVQIIARVSQIAAMTLVWIYPSVITYLLVTLFMAVIEAGFWVFDMRRYRYRPVGGPIQWLRELKFITVQFAIWNHGVAKSLFLIYWIDSLLLQMFVSNETIGDYAIALRTGNFLFLIPAVFEKNMIVTLSRSVDKADRASQMSFLMKVNAAVSLAMLAAAALAVPFYLKTILDIDVTRSEAIVGFFVPLAIGASLRNLGRPLDAIILRREYIAPFAMYVMAPLLALAVTAYWLAGSRWGATGMAWANVLVFGVYLVWTTGFALRLKVISPSMFLISQRDRTYARRSLEMVYRFLRPRRIQKPGP
jgi:O-antigen/teichoic acid export membrane protein